MHHAARMGAVAAVAVLLGAVVPACTREWDQNTGSPSDCDGCAGTAQYGGQTAVQFCSVFCALDGDDQCGCSYRCDRSWECGSDPTCDCLSALLGDENFPDAVSCSGALQAKMVVTSNYCP